MLAVGCCTINSTSNKLPASAHSNKRLLFFRDVTKKKKVKLRKIDVIKETHMEKK